MGQGYTTHTTETVTNDGLSTEAARQAAAAKADFEHQMKSAEIRRERLLNPQSLLDRRSEVPPLTVEEREAIARGRAKRLVDKAVEHEEKKRARARRRRERKEAAGDGDDSRLGRALERTGDLLSCEALREKGRLRRASHGHKDAEEATTAGGGGQAEEEGGQAREGVA